MTNKAKRQQVNSNNTPSSTGSLTPKDKSRQGGPEDLMVTGRGGTLPLTESEVPGYYKKSQQRQ